MQNARSEEKVSGCSCGSSAQGSCCGGESGELAKPDYEFITGYVETPAGEIPRVSTVLSIKDTLGSWKARWGINRMNYMVSPGLYCVGNPDKESPVLVTANYKMSFDRLRKELAGLNAWIMVLDTRGINVWCAAGKGTFGTGELVKRIEAVKLTQIVSHRELILPQLGAPGIAAHEVRKQSGFKVKYGPVRASDIPAFIKSGMKATAEMRTVRFDFLDRLVLTPIELVQAFKLSITVFGIMFILNAIGICRFGFIDFYSYIGALLTGCVLAPVMLPFIPGRAFAWKGWLLGFLWTAAVNIMNGWPIAPSYSWIQALAYLFVLPAVSAFCTMNFTGASTYTSLSGVMREMKIAVPLIIVSAGAGVILVIAGNLLRVWN